MWKCMEMPFVWSILYTNKPVFICLHVVRPFYSTDNAIGIIMGPKLEKTQPVEKSSSKLSHLHLPRYRKRWTFTPF